MTVTAPNTSPTSLPEGSGPTSRDGAATLLLLPSHCFICNDDDAEPIAVGQDFCFRSSPDTFLAVRCRTCGLVYLNPIPPPSELERADLSGPALGREIARFRRSLGSSAQVLHVHRIEDLDHAGDTFDAVLLTDVLERVDDPLGTLKATRRLLRPDGIALIATPNTDSSVCRVFEGRHWSGYNFPRHRNLFCARALGQAARMAGLEIVSVRTVGTPDAWVQSVRNTVTDWGFPRWAVGALNRTSGAAHAAGAAIEWWQQFRGRGGLLLATLRMRVE